MTTKRDVDTAVGMFIAYNMVKELREQNKTPVDLLKDMVGLDDVHIAMLYDIAENHAEAQLEAVAEVEARLEVDYSDREDGFREKAIKQSMVMAAISEGNLAQDGKTFNSLDLKGAEFLDQEQRLMLVTNDLEPGMVAMMADVIVSESYPNEKPVKDILTALWIEGFIVSLVSDEILLINKNDPRVQKTYAVAEVLFGGLDD